MPSISPAAAAIENIAHAVGNIELSTCVEIQSAWIVENGVQQLVTTVQTRSDECDFWEIANAIEKTFDSVDDDEVDEAARRVLRAQGIVRGTVRGHLVVVTHERHQLATITPIGNKHV
jgi:hypothetical protein